MVKTIVFVSIIIIIIIFFFLCKRSLSDKHDTYTGINVKKTVVLNTLVTMTLASDVENSKN